MTLEVRSSSLCLLLRCRILIIPPLGKNTLHGGDRGWDQRAFTLVTKSSDSVTYKYVDDAQEGFPGVVTAFVCVVVLFASENSDLVLRFITLWKTAEF